MIVAEAHANESRTIAAHEPLEIPASVLTGHSNSLSFEAFGRQFRIALRRNHRLGSLNGMTTTAAMQGRLVGRPGSWARLTRTGGFIEGIIRDGGETFVVEPRHVALPGLEMPDDSTSAHVIFRLSDVTIKNGAPGCGMRNATPGQVMNVQAAMDDLTSELKALQAQGARLRLSAAVLADYEFFLDLGSVSQTESAIITRFNIVDGIYTEQLGIEIELADITVLTSPDAAQPPFTDTNNPEALLDQLSIYRRSNQRQFGVSHLISGRDFPGTTAGIAYQGQAIGSSLLFGICDGETGASLSSGQFSTTTSALIIAHELGHNFGSPHDGEVTQPQNPCESSPETFLMAPDINSSREFSPCSLEQIQPVLDAARSVCLTPIPNEGVAVSGIAATTQPPGSAIDVTFEVRNTGDLDAPNVTISLTIPESLPVTNLSSSAGTCDLESLTCDLGTLGSGQTQTVSAIVQADTEGVFLITASSSTNFDEDLTDNAVTSEVTVAATPARTDSSGGGGAITLSIAVLLGLVRLRRRFSR